MIILRSLSAIVLKTAIILVASSAQSGPKLPTNCTTQSADGSACAPILACLGKSGTYFVGQAVGWGAGTHAGQSSAGFACSGEWRAKGTFGLGEADIECDNGLTGRAFFTYQHSETGTATGTGLLSNGEPFRVWTGTNVQQFLINEYGDFDVSEICISASKPVS